MGETGNKLVLSFGHSINIESVTLYRDPKRAGNTLNQIGQVMDELVSEVVAERDREIERLTAELDARSRDVAHMIGERDASQAREREAVERAEKAEAQRRHDDDADTACRNLLCEERDVAEQERDEARTALAAARKALEANRAAVSDACHAIAIYGDQPPQMYLDALAVADAALERINGEGG